MEWDGSVRVCRPDFLYFSLAPVMDTKRENPASICPHCGESMRLAMTIEGDGEIVFEHSCKLGCEGIVSKRLGSTYRSGRSPHWVKVKTQKHPL